MQNSKEISYKPEGFQCVVPYLHVKGAAKMIDFLKQAFGAEELGRYPQPDGSISHAAVKIGDSFVELADSGDKWPAMPCGIHIFVPDTDATYRRAIEAGATSLHEPADQFYGERSAGVRDFAGNNWYIATVIENVSKEEMDRRVATMAAQH
jgi:PhnB protein